MPTKENRKTCEWPRENLLMMEYHDQEWGVPLHDDQKLFEFLVLEGFQAGLSWLIVLRKRENFRKAFDDFNVDKVAKYTQRKIDSLLVDAGIIRNRLKVEGTIANAKAFIKVREEFGTFDKYIWGFVKNKPIDNKTKTHKDLKATSELSDSISADLKKRGFKFVGSTIVYAHMQATGMLNDHLVTCHRYKEVNKPPKNCV